MCHATRQGRSSQVRVSAVVQGQKRNPRLSRWLGLEMFRRSRKEVRNDRCNRASRCARQMGRKMPCYCKEISSCSKLKTEKVEQKAEGANEQGNRDEECLPKPEQQRAGHGWGRAGERRI